MAGYLPGLSLHGWRTWLPYTAVGLTIVNCAFHVIAYAVSGRDEWPLRLWTVLLVVCLAAIAGSVWLRRAGR